MNKTKIEWCDYTWNPVVGCKRGCPYCYARKIHERFNRDFPFEVLTWHDERLKDPLKVKKPSRIFVGSMSDIEYWRSVDIYRVLQVVERCPQHTFLFLTKNGLVYGDYVWPKNCLLGVTTVNGNNYKFSVNQTVKPKFFLSIEPLMQEPKGIWLNSLISWVIVGGMTPKPVHKKEWIDGIVQECDRLKIPVFIKQNAGYQIKRQEYERNSSGTNLFGKS